MKKQVIGIDPGLKGAVAVLEFNEHGDSRILIATTMPVAKAVYGNKNTINEYELCKFFKLTEPDLVIIEAVHAMPGQGTVSMFNFGMGFGKVLGSLAGVGLPYKLVSPQTWKKDILAGTRKDKKAAINLIKHRYPDFNLLPTARSKIEHDGLADAICIAEYGYRVLSNNNNESKKQQVKKRIKKVN